jgi:hypothetical protein
MSSQSGLIIFPLYQGEEIFSAGCVDGKIKGPASGRRGWPIHKVNLSPASTHGHLEVKGGLHHSLHLDGSPGSVSASLVLWRAIVPSPVGKVYSGGPRTRFIFGAGSTKKMSSFSFPPPLSCLEPPSRLPRRKRTPLPCCGGVSSARKGSIEGGPHPRFIQAPLHSAPGFSLLSHGDTFRRPPCLLLWGLGGVLSF